MDIKKILKIVVSVGGAIGLLVPLWGATLQYQQSVQQNLDQNFRSVVNNLSSEKREDRLAAAANMGTFIKKGIFKKEKYYDEAVDILINTLSIEIDYNVSNAINGSLEKIYKEKKYKEYKEYKEVIDKLLAINRNIFIQEYALNNWKNAAKTIYDTAKANPDVAIETKEEIRRKWEIFFKREQDWNELPMHQRVTADSISLFLRVTKSFPIEGLVFIQNPMSGIRMVELNLSNSIFKLSDFSSSAILDTKFNKSTITKMTFTFSDLTNSSFTNCSKINETLFAGATLKNVDFSASEFSDVYFTDADIEGAKFNGVRGLKPIYFYKSKNIDKAIFDAEFKKELNKTITKSEFIEFVNNSKLSVENRDILVNIPKDENITSP